MAQQLRAQATRDRVIAAAAAEFAERGVAGARINRIADIAQASKERIYAWYGDKDALFDLVMESGLEQLAGAVPITTDLVDYTVRLFEHFLAHPESQRVAVWAWIHDAGLEESLSSARLHGYRHKIATIELAQREGLADAGWDPAELLALLISTATSWIMAPAELRAIGTVRSPDSRREAVRRAAARLVRPARALLGEDS